MKPKELQLLHILDLKYQMAEATVSRARATCDDIEDQIEVVNARRNVRPTDPADQIYHERHIGWLDQRSRQLSILAAQATVEYNVSKDALRIEFGRKTALSKALARRAEEQAKRVSRQLS